MSNYTGSECIICNDKFKDGDDIVVCPECGTPYHRDCYLKEGKCVNTKLHDDGISWAEENKKSGGDDAQKKCIYCGTVNRPHAIICENCGASMVEGLNFQQNTAGNTTSAGMGAGTTGNTDPFSNASYNPNDKYCGMNPDEKFEDITLSEAAEFVGTNRFYYLTLFKRIKETGKKISLNVICLLFPQFYFASRKMWVETIISVLFTFALSVPALIYYMSAMDVSAGILDKVNINSSSFEMILRVTNYASWAFKAVMCLFANWFYYRHTIKKIRTIKNNFSSDEKAASEKIKTSGGTSVPNMVIAFGIQFVLTLVLMYAFIYI